MKRKILISLMLIIGVLIAGFIFITIDGANYAYFSEEEKLEDFDYLWNELDRSYPFFGVAERSEIDVMEVYEEYRQEIADTKSDMHYLNKLNAFLHGLGDNGHLSVVSPVFYNNVVKPTFENARSSKDGSVQMLMLPWIDIACDPEVEEVYSHFVKDKNKFLIDKYPMKEADVDERDETAPVKNLDTDILVQDEIAYISINSFDFNSIEEDRETLFEFYEEIDGYPNLIIDIRENRGGSDLYWKNTLVAPNIEGEMSFDRYSLFKLSEVNKPYIDSVSHMYHIAPIDQLPIKELVDERDMNEMSHYLMERSSVEPLSTERKFEGRIWVLVSEKVYSSSENFAMFCKNTGFATLVGNTTGGDGGTIDPVFFTLPNSGLLVRYSMLLGLNNDGSSNEEYGTTPDFKVLEDEDALQICMDLIANQ